MWLWPESLLTQSLLVGAVVGVAAYLLLSKRYKLPPGPRGLPLLGSVLDLRSVTWYRKLQEWGKEYGPVFTFRIFMVKIIVLSNIEMALEAFVKRQADIAGRPTVFSGEVFTEGGSDIINGNYGPRWKLHRKIASKAFRQYLVGTNLNQKLSESLAITTSLMKKEEGAFEPFNYLSFLVYNILSGICFNKTSPDTSDARYDRILTTVDDITAYLRKGMLEDFLPIMRYCPTNNYKQFAKLCRKIQDVITNEIEEHKETYSEGVVRDLLDSLIEAQNEAEREEDPEVMSQITDKHVRQTIQDVFFAGVDTSRITLYWALLAVAIHPDIQRKIQQEVDGVIGPDLVVDTRDRDHLSYTEAVLHEAMRMRPAAPVGVPHVALCDTTVGGYEIPKGTVVGVNHYALHFDPDQWDEPEIFRPERFLDASGKLGPKPDSWLPFSAGRRVCLGETIAKPELHLLFAGLCRAFTIELEPGTSHDFEPVGSGGDMLPKPFKIVVKPRV